MAKEHLAAVAAVPSWDDLRILLLVSETGSLSAAAALLNVAHTTVGRRIRALEARIGRQLVAPGNTGLRLTPEGKVVVEIAQRMLTEAREVEFLRPSNGEAALRGTVRINATEGLGGARLMPRFAGFEGRHRRIVLK